MWEWSLSSRKRLRRLKILCVSRGRCRNGRYLGRITGPKIALTAAPEERRSCPQRYAPLVHSTPPQPRDCLFWVPPVAVPSMKQRKNPRLHRRPQKPRRQRLRHRLVNSPSQLKNRGPRVVRKTRRPRVVRTRTPHLPVTAVESLRTQAPAGLGVVALQV